MNLDFPPTAGLTDVVTISVNPHTNDSMSVLTDLLSPPANAARRGDRTIDTIDATATTASNGTPQTPTDHQNDEQDPTTPSRGSLPSPSAIRNVNAYVSPSANPTNLPLTPELRQQLFVTEADIDEVVALGYDSDGYHPQMNEMNEMDEEDDFDEEPIATGIDPIVLNTRNTESTTHIEIPNTGESQGPVDGINNSPVDVPLLNRLSEAQIKKMTVAQLK
jgi:hypothetical protein